MRREREEGGEEGGRGEEEEEAFQATAEMCRVVRVWENGHGQGVLSGSSLQQLQAKATGSALSCVDTLARTHAQMHARAGIDTAQAH